MGMTGTRRANILLKLANTPVGLPGDTVPSTQPAWTPAPKLQPAPAMNTEQRAQNASVQYGTMGRNKVMSPAETWSATKQGVNTGVEYAKKNPGTVVGMGITGAGLALTGPPGWAGLGAAAATGAGSAIIGDGIDRVAGEATNGRYGDRNRKFSFGSTAIGALGGAGGFAAGPGVRLLQRTGAKAAPVAAKLTGGEAVGGLAGRFLGSRAVHVGADIAGDNVGERTGQALTAATPPPPPPRRQIVPGVASLDPAPNAGVRR